ncbi:MAG: tetratricopeptide repeat protein, partial [Ruminococcus sp.]|nr:tetratricopeptide repeat protein [Ruminococcus sp.]
MAEFQIFTRGSSIPRGKQRVYFTCHPQDSACFPEIKGDILERQNCAVYRIDNPAAQPDDVPNYRVLLSEMQLFVVPVTTALLTTPNRAMGFDVPFALAHHIPVLPLMRESDLDALFKAKFGDLQYLDKNDPDPTALPYGEKLSKYLEAIIVGDKLAQQVRAAFDAYIFMSYRKKDRQYAQELMKLIHADPRCRDIAIWYDEYLTPGEDFNEAIREALEKSELFALAVTPNLVNEINYILNIEYPMAHDMGKSILPAEMVPTDHDKLREMYDGIPETVSVSDREQFWKRVLTLLRGIAVAENDNDPQHNFFIGLAYLNGIDVETDRDRAVELITGAAEQEYLPAMWKLVEMYRHGDGVRRDPHMVIEWLKRVAGQCWKEYQKKQTDEAAIQYIRALWELGEAHQSMSELGAAQMVYRKMHDAGEAFARKFRDDRFVRYQSAACEFLGDLARENGMLQEAAQWYNKTLQLRNGIRQIEKKVRQNDFTCIYDRLGIIAQEQGKLDEAEKQFRKSLAIREKLVASWTPEARSNLSISYTSLGEIAQARGRLQEAEQWFRKAYALDQALAEETKTIQSRRALAVTCNNLGFVAMSQQRLPQAEKWFRQALAITEDVIKDAGTVQMRRDLLVCCDRLGDVVSRLGRIREAEEWYRRGYACSDAIARETGTYQANADLALSCCKLAGIAKSEGRLDEAEPLYRRGLAIREKLAKRSGTIDARRDVAFSYESLGDIASARNRTDEAAQCYRRGMEILEALVRKAPVVQLRSNLALFCDKLGSAVGKQGNRKEEAALLRRAHTIRQAIAKETGTVDAQRDLSISYDKFGEAAEAQGRLDEAENWYRRALAIRKSLAAKNGTLEAQRDLSVSYINLGNLAEEQGDLRGAEEWFRRSTALREAILRQSPSVSARKDLRFCYAKLAALCISQEKYDKAEAYYRLAQEQCETLVRDVNTPDARCDLALILYMRGWTADLRGKPSEAVDYCRQSLAYLAPDNKTDRADTLFRLGYVLMELDELTEAAEHFRECVTLRKQLLPTGDAAELRYGIYSSLYNLGRIAERQERYGEAADC